MPLIRKTSVSLFFIIIAMINIQLAIANQNTHGNNHPTPIVIAPDTLSWHSFDAFPPGAVAAVLWGNPRRSEPFMLRIKVPANYMVPPNWQTANIFVTVLSGKYSIGVGNKFNAKNGKTLPSTGSVIIPANTHLYFWSKRGATLEVHGIGPWDIHYVNPRDDPRNNH